MSSVARSQPPAPDLSPEAARARGEVVLAQLDAQGISPEALTQDLTPDDTQAVLAWMRGEGPCPAVV